MTLMHHTLAGFGALSRQVRARWQRTSPMIGLIMIASCTQFDFQTPHFVPADAMFVPELIDGKSGGEQALIFPPEHLIQLLGRGGEKHAQCSLGTQWYRRSHPSTFSSEVNGLDLQHHMDDWLSRKAIR